MGLDLLFLNFGSMNVLHKTRNLRKDPRPSSPSFNGLVDGPGSPAIQIDYADADDFLSSNLQFLEASAAKKSKNILPKRSFAMSSSESHPNDSSKYSNDYYSANSSLWNSMINNLNYEKNGWSDPNWGFNDWNALGSDLTTNSGTVNSLNEEKNSDIFQNHSNNSSNSSSNDFSNLNCSSDLAKNHFRSGNNSFSTSKSFSSDGSKMESTAETTPETLINNSFQSVNFSSLNGYQFPSLLKSYKDVNSFMNNHPPLSYYKADDAPKFNNASNDSKSAKNKKDSKDVNFDREFDFANITQSNGPPVTVKVYTSWNGEGENTISVKKSEKVQLVARSGNWIYVRVLTNLNRCGWIPEFTLVESEMLSRKMLSN